MKERILVRVCSHWQWSKALWVIIVTIVMKMIMMTMIGVNFTISSPQEKKHNTTSITTKKKIMEVIYILLHLYIIFCCNGNLNLLHQYEIVAIIIMLH